MKGSFLDIGANVGQTFDDFLSKDPKYDGWDVWCFEPSPRHLSGLMETSSRYRDRYKIHICPFGVSDENGLCLLYQKTDPRGDSFHYELEARQGVKNIEPGYSIVVPSKGIMEVLDMCYGDETVIKLDCEGSEYQILETMKDHNIGLFGVSDVYVEFHEIGEAHRAPEEICQDLSRQVSVKQWMF